MLAGLLYRAAIVPREAATATSAARGALDAGFAALPRLKNLSELLAKAARKPRSQLKEPPVFFLDRQRQAELDTARAAIPVPDPFPEVTAAVAAEMPMFIASRDVRRVARATAGLRVAAESLAPCCPAASELTELLNVPDEEVVTVLHPELGVGFRLLVGGTADLGHFFALLLHAVRDHLPGSAKPGPSGLVEQRYQMFTTAALRPDGSLPTGLSGSDHWLWPRMPFGAIPRRDGERVVLLGPPAYPTVWEVSPRFPGFAAEVQLLDVLTPAHVAEHLTRLTGSPVSP